MKHVDEQLLRNSSEVFTPEESFQDSNSKRALIIVPDMSLNGAQTVLFGLLDIFRELSYSLTIISSEDGEYREKYTSVGATVAIRPSVAASEEFKEYMRSAYDLVFINTSSCLPYVYFFINTKVRTIWWLHESRIQLESCGTNIPAPQLLSPNITIAAVIRSVQDGLREMFDHTVPILPLPVPDQSEEAGEVPEGPSDGGKVRFFIPAAYTVIKGQDILLSAIAKLPPEYAARSEFIFCGYELPRQKEYSDRIKEIATKLPNVQMLGAFSREEVFDYYRMCDCVVAPSRVDSAPTSIIEAMMFGKLTLVSSNTGISHYMTDCVNGFVFTNEDELFKRLLLIISDPASLRSVGEKGRLIYDSEFSKEAVTAALQELIQ